MRQLQRLAALALALSLGPVCAPSEADHVGDYLAARDDGIRGICKCDYNQALAISLFRFPPETYGSTEECVSENVHDSAVNGCVSGLFADEPVDYSSVLDCRARAIDEGAACLSAAMCDQTGTRVDCYDAYTDAYNACADLPDDVENKLNDCLYN